MIRKKVWSSLLKFPVNTRNSHSKRRISLTLSKMENENSSTNSPSGDTKQLSDSPNAKLTGSPLQDISNRTNRNRPFRVSIEGNIGAGKSTLIKYFQNIKDIETYGEPLDWWRNLNGHNLLDLMYSDIHTWLKVFQSYVQLTRMKIQTSKPKNSSTTVQIYERSIQNNRFCFVEQAYKSGFLNGGDFAVLDQWYTWIEQNIDISLDLIVYLRSTPEIVYQRMKSRGRPEESGVSLEYLQGLHESHEKWLMTGEINTVPVLVLDADKTLEEIYEQYRMNEHKILGRQKKFPTMDQPDHSRVKRTLQLD